mmetsp:Transcript_30170/g.53070  ORF Transcript_30170/g.53070 Transcript_30170/m.53070 type:complete len:361 (+) Transcript_30170:172-1254(+)
MHSISYPTTQTIYNQCIERMRNLNNLSAIDDLMMSMARVVINTEQTGAYIKQTETGYMRLGDTNKTRTQLFIDGSRALISQICSEFHLQPPPTTRTKIRVNLDSPLRVKDRHYSKDPRKDPFIRKVLFLEDLPDHEPNIVGRRNMAELRLEERLRQNMTAGLKEIMDNCLWHELYQRMYGNKRNLSSGDPICYDPGFCKWFDKWEKNNWPYGPKKKEHVLAENINKKLVSKARQIHKTAYEAGKFDAGILPATKIDKDFKKDFRLLARKSLYFPGRYYKNPESTKFPRYFGRAWKVSPAFKGVPRFTPIWKVWSNTTVMKKYKERMKKRFRAIQEYTPEGMGKKGKRPRRIRHKQKRRNI